MVGKARAGNGCKGWECNGWSGNRNWKLEGSGGKGMGTESGELN